MTTARAAEATAPRWEPICRYDQLEVEQGMAALVEDVQVAIFRTFDGRLFALDNQDPFTGAFVLSRGIVGDRDGVPTVASPLHKQAFDLRTGGCLDEQHVAVPTYGVRLHHDVVEVAIR
jgi:nitrite reductase (NADH) small subunit